MEAVDAAFAALLENGSVVSWGTEDSEEIQAKDVTRILAARWLFLGLRADGSCTAFRTKRGVPQTIMELCQGLRHVQQFEATEEEGVAALLADGRVIASGARLPRELQERLGKPGSVKQIASTAKAFCALLTDGQVVTWGDPRAGGDLRNGGSWHIPYRLADVTRVEATDRAFAAILADGSAVAWGDPNYGGDCSKVQDQLKEVQQNLSL